MTTDPPSPVWDRFADRLAAAQRAAGSHLCIGLDPEPSLLPTHLHGTDGILDFCRAVVEATSDLVCAYKPNLAFFERWGAEGWRALETLIAGIPSGTPVIADAKRGDIGSTAQAYAEAWLGPRDGGRPVADAVTVNPYMGGDSLEPFLNACGEGAGLFVLTRTSNPGGADIEEQRLADGRPVWERVAELVAEWGASLVGESGLSSVGAVLGATYPENVERARELMPHQILLMPGVGAQGGSAELLGAAFRDHPAGGLVVAARSVIYAWRERRGDWRQSVRSAAAELREATPTG